MHLFTGRLTGSFAVKLLLAAALVILGDQLFLATDKEIGALPIATFFLAQIVALMIARPAVRRDPRALFALAIATAMAVGMALKPNPITFLLFWIAVGVATLLPRTGRFDDGWRWFQRLVVLGFFAIPAPFIDRNHGARAASQRGWHRPGLLGLLRLLALPLAGSAVVVSLFAAANPVIDRLLATFSIPLPDGTTVWRMICWVMLLLVSWPLLRPRLARRLFGTFDGSGDWAIPGVSTGSVLLSLAAFNLLFAAQNAMDAAWLWGLVPLPEGVSAAEYVHRGAYPLIATALFAGLFVLVFLRPGSATAQNRAIRRLVIAWIAQNLFLVASSALRTIDYIDAYLLTTLRISALLWMALVATGLFLILWRLLKQHSAAWLLNANLAVAGLLLCVCAFVDLGSIAAQWNVRHAREIDGDGAKLDLCYASSLGGSSLLPLLELEQSNAPADLRQRARWVRRDIMVQLQDEVDNSGGSLLDRWRLAQAWRMLDDKRATPTPTIRDCYGRPYR
ncbi:DUF4153 domain-containing protein [Novosphingobium sp. Rr 2-17]|uniref:DUF4153 domain-containing protein n=1 Tax=Novosphingobium sp. Rr 2-17 TaxID=555793 RepID=UPI0002DDD41C|nr:DUF4173 domain-containing protein [Novosphingobium sp. Rr 2-17]